MPSESQTSTTNTPTQSFLERLINSRNRELSLLLPFILQFTTTSVSDPDDTRVESPESTTDPVDNSPNRPSPDESTRPERLGLLNSLIRNMGVLADPDDTRVELPESAADPVDNSSNRPSPDESTRPERVVPVNSLLRNIMELTDPDENRVELPESDTDPVENSPNRPSPDESTRPERVALINSLIRNMIGITDPDENRVELPESDTDPVDNPSNRSSPDELTRLERVILINSLTRNMVVMEGMSFDSMLRGKDGDPPASKSAVEELPRVEIREGEEGERGDCVICLEEYKVGSIVKKMPCQHEFHEGCLEKWLGLHGSCPMCRYKLPFDQKSEERESGGVNGGRVNREFWIRVSFGGGRRRNGGGGGGGDGGELA